jgi:hypothetical protein
MAWPAQRLDCELNLESVVSQEHREQKRDEVMQLICS